MISQITDLILFKFMYASDYSKNLITVEEKVAELMKQRDQLRAQVERLTHLETVLRSSAADMTTGRITAGGVAELRAQVERLRSDRDCEKRLRKDADELREDAIERAERAEAELKAERAIVSRIWTQLGSPTYEQLRGRSIYDLISELKANATSSAPRWKREREWQAGIIAHAQLHHAERKEAIARAERAEAELANYKIN